jgi:hypothetical protein
LSTACSFDRYVALCLGAIWRTAESGRPTWKDKRPFARTESCSDYRGKYLILLVNSRHIRDGFTLARVAAGRRHYAK